MPATWGLPAKAWAWTLRRSEVESDVGSFRPPSASRLATDGDDSTRCGVSAASESASVGEAAAAAPAVLPATGRIAQLLRAGRYPAGRMPRGRVRAWPAGKLGLCAQLWALRTGPRSRMPACCACPRTLGPCHPTKPSRWPSPMCARGSLCLAQQSHRGAAQGGSSGPWHIPDTGWADAPVRVQGQLQGMGAQWDFIESLNGGSFLAGSGSAAQHSPPESTGEALCSSLRCSTCTGPLRGLHSGPWLMHGARSLCTVPSRPAAGGAGVEVDGTISQRTSGWGDGQAMPSQAPGSEGTQTPRSIVSTLERQPSGSTVKSVKFLGARAGRLRCALAAQRSGSCSRRPARRPDDRQGRGPGRGRGGRGRAAAGAAARHGQQRGAAAAGAGAVARGGVRHGFCAGRRAAAPSARWRRLRLRRLRRRH